MEDHDQHALKPGSAERADNLRQRFTKARLQYDWRFDSWSAPWRQTQLLGLRIREYGVPAALGVAIVFGGLALFNALDAPNPWIGSTAPAGVRTHASPFHSADMQRRHLYASHGCREAESVGLAPAYRGEPGYWPQNDGDDDGIACEWYGPRRR